jgi:hypothetical protein
MKPGNPPAPRQEGCQFRRIIAFRKMRGMSNIAIAQPLKMQGFFCAHYSLCSSNHLSGDAMNDRPYTIHMM